MTESAEERGLLERKAELARSRLLSTLDALDHRRQNIAAIAGEVKRAAATTALALATATAAATAYLLLRTTFRRRTTWEAPRRTPGLVEAFETLTVVGLTYGVGQLARAASRKAVPRRPPLRPRQPRAQPRATAASPGRTSARSA